jgi:neutral ceramidase
MRKFLAAGAAMLALAGATASPALAGLKVGAAKVDITPDARKLPAPFTGVLDPILVRAIALESDGQKAALITIDAGAVPDPLWTEVTTKLKSEFGIEPSRVMFTATHTHSVPFTFGSTLAGDVVKAVREALGRMQPGRVAYAEGRSYINVNRNIIDSETRRWWEGPNVDGPSDKTVAILRFENEAGKPVAVYYNYAVHAVLTGNLDLISGDLPGAASRYIEQSLGDDVVALWSEGAAGDQNPIFFQQTYDLREIRIADYAKRGEDISNAMPPGGVGMDRKNPQVAKLMDQQKQMALSMGQMLGEEVLQAMRMSLERPEQVKGIAGASKSVMCPGRNRTDKGRAGYPGTYVDADDVPIRLSMLRLGNVYIGGVNAEVFNPIATSFKSKAPSRRTMMATLTNGIAPSGYIPHDAAYAQNTFEVISSRLKQGCAETAIVEGLLDLVAETEAGN